MKTKTNNKSFFDEIEYDELVFWKDIELLEGFGMDSNTAHTFILDLLKYKCNADFKKKYGVKRR